MAVVLAAVAAGLLLSAALASNGPGAAPSASALPGNVGGHVTSIRLRDVAAGHPGPGVSVVARARRPRDGVAIYRHRGDRRPARRVMPRTVDGKRAPLVFLVEGRRRNWVHVKLPVRPNGSRGWVRSSAVRLRTDPYALAIHLRANRLVVRRRGHVILRTHVAVGKAASPTPRGHYFIIDLLRPPDPHGAYGPYALGLSAYSSVYTNFAGGDGQVGIHGTNEPALIGSDISHGCIRVHNAIIKRLARLLPLGTSVMIVN